MDELTVEERETVIADVLTMAGVLRDANGWPSTRPLYLADVSPRVRADAHLRARLSEHLIEFAP